MRTLFTFILLIIIAAIAVLAYTGSRQDVVRVASFEECVAAGNPVMESYPRQCRTPEGELFVEQIQEMAPEVMNVNITAGSVVSSPLVVTGEARGNWFFEANLPIQIKDANGTVLGQVGAQAQGEWMTTDFVPFAATTTFTQSSTDTGTLVIMNDNPSGLPENQKMFEIPIRFVVATSTSGAGGGTQLAECRPVGCSQQICSDDYSIVTTCEFKEEYACYTSTNAKCERQSNGFCGWTPSQELTMCINNARQAATI